MLNMENLIKANVFGKDAGNREDIRINKKLPFVDKHILLNYYYIKDYCLDEKVLQDIIVWIYTCMGKYKILTIELENVIYDNRLCYVILECIVEYLAYSGINVNIILKNTKYTNSNINTIINGVTKGRKVYERYRKIAKYNAKENTYSSIIMSDLCFLLKAYGVGEENSFRIADVAAELTGNALEHGRSDCLIDCMYTKQRVECGGDKKEIKWISLIVMNVSGILLGDPLYIKYEVCKEREKYKEEENYPIISEAYKYHQRDFSEKYGKRDFYLISSFQDRITGRREIAYTGGTGLTTLIGSAKMDSNNSECYVHSGNKKLIFNRNILGGERDGLVGFNIRNEFIHYIPDLNYYVNSPLYIPGTAYNLNYFIRS